LLAFITEIDKFEEKDVNNFPTEKKVAYFQEKIGLLRAFLDKYKGRPSKEYSPPSKEYSEPVPEPDLNKVETPREEKKIPVRSQSTVKNLNAPKTIETPKTTESTPSTSGSDSSGLVKSIMNQVFKKVKGKVSPGTEYEGTTVLSMMKELIIEATNTNNSGTEEDQATVKSIMNNVFKTIKSSFQSDTSYDGEQILESIKQTIIKITNDLLNQQKEQPSQSTNEETNTRIERSESVLSKDPSENTTSAGIEVQRRDAESRINQNPTEKDVDLTDPEVIENYIRVRNDNDPMTWVIYKYDLEVKNRVVVLKTGEGNFSELKEYVPDDIPVYFYFKYIFGDTQRSKFVFISYVPESFHGIQKSKVLGHRPAFKEFIKYYSFDMAITDTSDLDENEIHQRLLKAGGANYSVQEQNKGDFGNYKTKTKSYYSEKEKSGSLKSGISYSQDPLSTTPMDISGRPTVAPNTDFKKNTKN